MRERAARVMKDEVERQNQAINLKEPVPQKQRPDDASEFIRQRRRHSTLTQDISGDKENTNAGGKGEDNPLVLIIAVNMYKGHTEKIHIYLKDTAEEIAKDFVKMHNLPEISVKNLEKLINKNLEKNNIVIGKKEEVKEKKVTKNPKAPLASKTSPAEDDNQDNDDGMNGVEDKRDANGASGKAVISPVPKIALASNMAKEKSVVKKGGVDDDDHKRSKNRSNGSPDKGRSTTVSPSPSPSFSSATKAKIRPVDMYRFIN